MNVKLFGTLFVLFVCENWKYQLEKNKRLISITYLNAASYHRLSLTSSLFPCFFIFSSSYFFPRFSYSLFSFIQSHFVFHWAYVISISFQFLYFRYVLLLSVFSFCSLTIVDRERYGSFACKTNVWLNYDDFKIDRNIAAILIFNFLSVHLSDTIGRFNVCN